MAESEPPDDALSLLEAFCRLYPYAAKLVRDRPACRWAPTAKDIRSQATNPFFEQMSKGALLAWGRPGSLNAAPVLLEAAAVEQWQVRDWNLAIIDRYETRDRPPERRRDPFYSDEERMAEYAAQGDGIGPVRKNWFSRPRSRTRTRATTERYVVETLYDVHVASAAAEPRAAPTVAEQAPPARPRRKGFSEAKVRDWVEKIYASKFHGQRPPNRSTMIKDVRDQFGDSVSKTFILKLKNEYLPGNKFKGRPPMKPAGK